MALAYAHSRSASVTVRTYPGATAYVEFPLVLEPPHHLEAVTEQLAQLVLAG